MIYCPGIQDLEMSFVSRNGANVSSEAESEHSLKTQHLREAARCLADFNLPLSRFYTSLVQDVEFSVSGNIVKDSKDQGQSVCKYCGADLAKGSHRTRIRPKMRRSSQIERLERKARCKGFSQLTRAQRKLLNKFGQSQVTKVMTCGACQKSSRTELIARPEAKKLKRLSQTFSPGVYQSPAAQLSTPPTRWSTPIRGGRLSIGGAARGARSAHSQPKRKLGRLQRMLNKSSDYSALSPAASLQSFLSSV